VQTVLSGFQASFPFDLEYEEPPGVPRTESAIGGLIPPEAEGELALRPAFFLASRQRWDAVPPRQDPGRFPFDVLNCVVYCSAGNTSNRREPMRTVLSVSLPKPLAAELSRLATKTGRTKSDIVKESVSQYLWEARLRAVQRRLSRRAKRAGMVTEDDVFRAIS